jgi:hypothetical protein
VTDSSPASTSGRQTDHIPGYTYGDAAVATSPVSLAEFELIKRTVTFGAEDERYLRLAGEILADQVDAFLDHWYSFQATLPHLGYYSTGPDGQPNLSYRAAARQRLRQWVLDLCGRPYDQDWLNYQHEIGLRHTRAKKNQTDRVESVPHIGYRYVLAQTYPFTQAMRQFLTRHGHSADDVEKMHQAWAKAVLLQIILWSYPYVKDGDF